MYFTQRGPTMADKTAFDYVNEIWSIANYVRDVIRPADYNKLILPFAVLRRFECALEPTRAVVSRQAAKGVWDDDDPKYCALSGHCFYNVTSFTLSNLGATKTCDALMAYINGFSANAREVLQRFEMRQTCEKLDEKGMLYEVCTRFAGFDLGPEAVSDRMMTDIYEHLIQRYGEEISQDAEDFMTPKDVARLATALLFANEDTLLNADAGDIRTLYDGSCGTCGFICDALDQLDEWHDKGHFSSPTKIVPYGQELEDATWAMGKAALMLRNIAGGSGDVLDQMNDLSAGIMLGDTLDDDKFEDRTFNYQLTNPPYGKEWKKEKDAVLEEMGRGFGGRFGAGKPDIDDGSMLFMQNVAAKMAPPERAAARRPSYSPVRRSSMETPAAAHRASDAGCSRRTSSTVSSSCRPRSSTALVSPPTYGCSTITNPITARGTSSSSMPLRQGRRFARAKATSASRSVTTRLRGSSAPTSTDTTTASPLSSQSRTSCTAR